MHKSTATRGLGILLALVGASAALTQCGGNQQQRPQVIVPPSCQLPQQIHLTIEGSDRLNLDNYGRSLPTIVRVYQLKGVTRMENAEFEDIWLRDRDTLGDDLVQVDAVTVFPGQRVGRAFRRNPAAHFVVAVAIVRHPAGISWRATYELPPSPDESRCRAQAENPENTAPAAPPDPRYYFFAEDYRIEAGEELPPEPDAGLPSEGTTRGDGGYNYRCWWRRDASVGEDVPLPPPGTYSCPDPSRAPRLEPTHLPPTTDGGAAAPAPASGGSRGSAGGRSTSVIWWPEWRDEVPTRNRAVTAQRSVEKDG